MSCRDFAKWHMIDDVTKPSDILKTRRTLLNQRLKLTWIIFYFRLNQLIYHQSYIRILREGDFLLIIGIYIYIVSRCVYCPSTLRGRWWCNIYSLQLNISVQSIDVALLYAWTSRAFNPYNFWVQNFAFLGVQNNHH